jgi:dihydroorotate dehydrogenase (NAD+) catalytic subunit
MLTKNFSTGFVLNSEETTPGSGVFLIKLKIDNFDEKAIRAGQFVGIIPKNGAAMKRPYAIAATDRSGITLYVQTVGGKNSNSRAFARSKGKSLDLTGPHGKPFELMPGVDNYILVAGKTGVAGLLLIAKEISAAGKKVEFLIGAKQMKELVGLEMLAMMRIKPRLIIDDGSAAGGKVTKLLEKALTEKQPKTAIVACGPKKMLKAVYDLAAAHHVPCLVSVELVMACTNHSCLGCALPMKGGKYKHTCQEGPLFNADDIDWLKFLPPEPPAILLNRFGKQPDDPLAITLYGKEGRTFGLNSVCMNGSGSLGLEQARKGKNGNIIACVTKGIKLEETAGNAFPRICEVPGGMINSIGLENIGVRRFIKEDLSGWLDLGKPLFINICAGSLEEFETIIRLLEAENLPPTVAYELNFGCPNVKQGGMLFGADPIVAKNIMAAARHCAKERFIGVKLTPNVFDIALIAGAVDEGGADFVTVCNTFVAMDVDLDTRRPTLGNVTGGLSGQCVLPLVLPKIMQVRRALPRMAIIASGGVTDGPSAEKCLIAGANAVQVATALFTNDCACSDYNAYIRRRLKQLSIPHSQDLVGSLVLPS